MLWLLKYILLNKNNLYIVFLPETIRALFVYRYFIKGPVIVSERNDPSQYSEKMQNKMFSAFNKADGIVYQTKTAYDFYKKHISTNIPWIIIPNSIRIYQGDRSNPNKQHIIVSAGRFNKQKNFPMLIKAFSRIHNEFPEYRLVIYGEGDLRKDYEELIAKLRLDKYVLLPGFAYDLQEKLSIAEVFVLSSDFEGIPNVLMEAMSQGIPCISTRCRGGGAEVLIENEKNGLLIPVGDTVKLAESIKRIITNPKFAYKLGCNAKKICKIYSADKVYSKWINFIVAVEKNKLSV